MSDVGLSLYGLGCFSSVEGFICHMEAELSARERRTRHMLLLLIMLGLHLAHGHVTRNLDSSL